MSVKTDGTALRKSYAQPRLTQYGSIAKLTTKTLGSADGGGTMMA